MPGQTTGPESAPRASQEADAAASPEILPEEFFRTSFAVLVRGKSIRRHLYFNLPAAERAVKRARARGDRADLLLVELVPVRGGGER